MGTPTDITDLLVELDSLTVEEVEILEEVTGAAFEQAFQAGRPKGKALRALAYIVGRRSDPTFTLEDAGRTRLSFAGSDVGRLDPTEPVAS
jgi:hypothetical protein